VYRNVNKDNPTYRGQSTPISQRILKGLIYKDLFLCGAESYLRPSARFRCLVAEQSDFSRAPFDSAMPHVPRGRFAVLLRTRASDSDWHLVAMTRSAIVSTSET
jgi:hypothetical protein